MTKLLEQSSNIKPPSNINTQGLEISARNTEPEGVVWGDMIFEAAYETGGGVFEAA